MFSWLDEYLRGEDDTDPSFILLTRNILIFVLAVNIALLPLVSGFAGEGSNNPPALFSLFLTLLLESAALYQVTRGRVNLAKAVVPLALIAAVMIISLNSNGLKNAAMVGLPIILLISSILVGRRFFVIVLPVALSSVFIVSYFDLNHRIPYVAAGLDDAIIVPLLLLGCAAIIQLLVGRLNENIRKAKAGEQMQRRENLELSDLRNSLERRVNLRTTELEITNRRNARRAKQFEAIAQVARAISTVQGLGLILPRITEVVSEKLGHYHTGIFLIDDQRAFAILQAANSDGGKLMLANGYKIRLGQTGIVGFVTGGGQPRIALDVGADAVYFDNPLLPNTHSEIALPLRLGGRLIGALDVQSEESNAFSENDIEVLSTLADQVSVAIQNTRTLEDANKALAEAQSSFSQITQEAWKVLRPHEIGLGYKLTGQELKPLESPLDNDEVHAALKSGETINNRDTNAPSLAIPIRLRNEIIGVMNLKTSGNIVITEDEVEIAEAVAERLSLAIETATLLRTTQRRADVEKVTTDISAHVSSSTRFDVILKTAAQELSRALGSEVVVQIDPVSFELSTGENQ